METTNKVKKRILFFFNLTLTCIYLSWRILFTLPWEYGMIARVAGLMLITIELIGALEAAVHYWNMYTVKNYPLPEVPLEGFPHVDVFIATYNEESDLLYKTINGCLYMDYPDKSKVHIYVCDDGRRLEIKALAKKMGVNYLERPDNKGAKAGNLNNAMSATDSPYVVTLDADMIPNHDFLMKTMPYFVQADIENRDKEEKDKEKIGFVQSPQAFYNPDLYQFFLFSENRIPNEQDYFYKDVQVSRNKSNSVIYGGSNTVLSREALNEVGGFYTDSITEDFATGILIQKAKYKCIAINTVLASGLSPTSMKELIQQRVRWARGVISTAKKVGIVFSSKLTIGQKINYMASVWYWYSPIKIFTYIMAPIMFATFGYVVIKCNLLQILIFWLPMYVTSNATLRMLSGNIRTSKWSKVYETILFPAMFFPVLFETFGFSMKTFKVTNKGGQGKAESKQKIVYSIPFVVFILLSLIGIYNSIKMIFITSSMSPIVVLFWLIANLFTLVMALFFVQGRTYLRKAERVVSAIDCEISDSYQTIQCKTIDFSETGISVLSTEPYFFNDDEEVTVSIWSNRYKAKIKARIIHVEKISHGWKYAFVIMRMEEEYKAQYMQLIYDRVPTLPLQLNQVLSSFDDLKLNIKNRAKAKVYLNRRLVRVDIRSMIETNFNNAAYVKDFNYKYLSLKNEIHHDIIILTLPNGLKLECKFEREIYDKTSLYSVTNMLQIYRDPNKRRLLLDWITAASLNDKEDGADEDKEKQKETFDEMECV